MYSTMLEELSKAIGARLLIEFSYNGRICIVEPHLVGKNGSGEDCLCAWQLHDTSAKETEDHWRCYLLNKISNLIISDNRFSKQRPGYDPYDNSMTRIYYRI